MKRKRGEDDDDYDDDDDENDDKKSKIPSKTKEFECEYCGKFFDTKGHLKEHTNTHTQVNLHKCPHCELESSKKSNITRHIGRMHPELNNK
jgi:uncharacterized Zn-finger protein